MGNIYTSVKHKISNQVKTEYSNKTRQVFAKIKRAKNKLKQRANISSGLNDLLNVTQNVRNKVINKLVVSGISSETILQKFEISSGVTLKAKNFVLKNKNREEEFIDQNGNRRITKQFFEKKLKNLEKGKRYNSLDNKKMRDNKRNKNRTLKKKESEKKVDDVLDRSRRIEEENQKRIFERIQSMTTSQEDEGQNKNMSKKKNDMKIYDKSYETFLKKISTSNLGFFRRKSSFKGGLASEINSMTTKNDLEEKKDEDVKLYLLNQKMREKESKFYLVNKPVDQEITYKNLKIGDSSHKKHSYSFSLPLRKNGGVNKPRDRPKRERKLNNRSFQLIDQLSLLNKNGKEGHQFNIN